FFQAEDGIRDRTVTGVQTCALPISDSSYRFERGIDIEAVDHASARAARLIVEVAGGSIAPGIIDVWSKPRTPKSIDLRFGELNRSEERRVGKECRSRW